MRRIVIEAVPQHDMRPPYDASEDGGDWFFDDDGNLVVRVIGESLADPAAFLFALHEMVEAQLCAAHGISQAAVDAFDERFEAERAAGKHGEDAEPGDHPWSPYRREHRQATLIEHLMAQFLGLDGYGEVR
jgi:hypothetical protein